jgi:hypothetical protein
MPPHFMMWGLKANKRLSQQQSTMPSVSKNFISELPLSPLSHPYSATHRVRVEERHHFGRTNTPHGHVTGSSANLVWNRKEAKRNA